MSKAHPPTTHRAHGAHFRVCSSPDRKSPLTPFCLTIFFAQSHGPWKVSGSTVGVAGKWRRCNFARRLTASCWICRRVLISSTGDTISVFRRPAYAPAALICHRFNGC